MTGISRYRLESLLQAQKVILSHQVQHALVVNDIAPVSEFWLSSSCNRSQEIPERSLESGSSNPYSQMGPVPVVPAIYSSRCDSLQVPGRIGILTTKGRQRGFPGWS